MYIVISDVVLPRGRLYFCILFFCCCYFNSRICFKVIAFESPKGKILFVYSIFCVFPCQRYHILLQVYYYVIRPMPDWCLTMLLFKRTISKGTVFTFIHCSWLVVNIVVLLYTLVLPKGIVVAKVPFYSYSVLPDHKGFLCYKVVFYHTRCQ